MYIHLKSRVWSNKKKKSHRLLSLIVYMKTKGKVEGFV